MLGNVSHTGLAHTGTPGISNVSHTGLAHTGTPGISTLLASDSLGQLVNF